MAVIYHSVIDKYISKKDTTQKGVLAFCLCHGVTELSAPTSAV